MRPQRPEPGAVAVELEVPPFVSDLCALDRVASMQEFIRADGLAGTTPIDQRLDFRRARLQDSRTPSEKCFGTGAISGPAHRVGDERSVAKPAVAVNRKVG